MVPLSTTPSLWEESRAERLGAAGTGRRRYKATPFSGLPSQSVSSSPRVPINQKNTEEILYPSSSSSSANFYSGFSSKLSS